VLKGEIEKGKGSSSKDNEKNLNVRIKTKSTSGLWVRGGGVEEGRVNVYRFRLRQVSASTGEILRDALLQKIASPKKKTNHQHQR